MISVKYMRRSDCVKVIVKQYNGTNALTLTLHNLLKETLEQVLICRVASDESEADALYEYTEYDQSKY